MADPGESETAGDEPWPYRIHTPTPPLLCIAQSATQEPKTHTATFVIDTSITEQALMVRKKNLVL